MTRKFLSQCYLVTNRRTLKFMIPKGRSGRTAQTQHLGFTAVDAMHSANILRKKNETENHPTGFLKKDVSAPERKKEQLFTPPDYYAEQVLGPINESVAIMFALEHPDGIPEPSANAILSYFRKLKDTDDGVEIVNVQKTPSGSIEIQLRHSMILYYVEPREIQELAIHVSAP